MRHGTVSGYRRHACRCESCKAANRDAMRAHRGSVVTGPVAVSARAYQYAVERLIERHTVEMRALLDDEVAREMTA